MNKAINMTLVLAKDHPTFKRLPGLPADALVAHVTRGVPSTIDLGLFLMKPDGTSLATGTVDAQVLAYVQAAMKVLANPA